MDRDPLYGEKVDPVQAPDWLDWQIVQDRRYQYPTVYRTRAKDSRTGIVYHLDPTVSHVAACRQLRALIRKVAR